MNTCKQCGSTFEVVEFSKGTKAAVMCPKCNRLCEPFDQTPRLTEPEEAPHPSLIEWPRQIKQELVRKKAIEEELRRQRKLNRTA